MFYLEEGKGSEVEEDIVARRTVGAVFCGERDDADLSANKSPA
jgi:hypothetical protein